MASPRFYTPNALSLGMHTLDKDASHHARVLRLRVGDALVLFNGDGAAYPAKIMSLDSLVCVEVSEAATNNLELPFELHIAQALIEPSKMDWVLEKCVELGVAGVQPIAAARSVTKLDEARAAKRLAHWHAISIAASQQCGRNRLMSVAAPQSLAQCVAAHPNICHVLLHPEGGQSLQAFCASRAPQSLMLWVGPEGGWTESELAALASAGAQRVSFGARVLRTETAALAVAAGLQALWG